MDAWMNFNVIQLVSRDLWHVTTLSPPRPYTSINDHVVAIYISLEKWFPLQGERAHVLLLHSHSSYPA